MLFCHRKNTETFSATSYSALALKTVKTDILYSFFVWIHRVKKQYKILKVLWNKIHGKTNSYLKCWSGSKKFVNWKVGIHYGTRDFCQFDEFFRKNNCAKFVKFWKLKNWRKDSLCQSGSVHRIHQISQTRFRTLQYSLLRSCFSW